MFTGTLLPYQVEAVEAMIDKKKMLVAYDLGLGKTVLTIAALESLLSGLGSAREPGIVICLSSLKYQWAEQIRRFTDAGNPLVVDGSPKKRAQQYQDALENKYSHIIVNYEQVVNDWETIQLLPRGFVVCDEATAIKSFRSKRSKYVKKLDSPIKFALTGTPIENGRPEELYSIMQFVNPKVLGRFDLFDKTFIIRNHFGGVERYKNIPTLNKTLTKASVRKKQDDPDVAPFLPAVRFAEPIQVPFDSSSSALYRSISYDLLKDLDEAVESFGSSFDIFSHYGYNSDQGGPKDAIKGKIMSKLTCLRMLCDHPDLIRESANSATGSKYAQELLDSGALTPVTKSNKLSVLKEYVDNFLSEYDGNKVVIFTSYVKMVDYIVESLEELGYAAVKYTGQMNAKAKEAAKTNFQMLPSIRVLVSSDAGGYGVDLPQANLLINYDIPWNAGLALQRNGRIRRASSTWKSIIIQNLVMENSIEERQHEMLAQKLTVASAIVDGEGFDEEGTVSLSVGSLRQFLSIKEV
jgi:SNF2 family DNA or RNA helicase